MQLKMNKLIEIIKYICINYPYAKELSNARLTKMIYLADWESSKINGHQITDIRWYFDNYGPYVDDVLNAAIFSEEISVIETENYYGTPKTLITIRPLYKNPLIDEDTKNILDKIIESTKFMFWKRFIEYVYETDPIKNNQRYTYLKLH